MIENRLELDIISLYDSNLKSLYSINQISKKLNKKYPYINKKVNRLIDSNILQKIILGRSHLCSLNLENDKTIILLTLHELNKKEEFFKTAPDHLETAIEKLKQNMLISCAVAIPSKEGRKILFVCDREVQKQKIIESLSDKAVNFTVFTRDEFLIKLSERKSMIFEDHVVLYGYERFFEFLTLVGEDITRLYSPLAI